jgi:hypothetical protein
MKELKDRWTGLRTTSINTFRDNPKYFKRVLDNKVDEDTPKFFELGTQVHMYVLEPEEFKDTYVFLDYTKPRGENQNKFAEYIAKEIKTDPTIDRKTLCVEAYNKAYKTKGKSEEKVLKESYDLYVQLEDYIRFLTVGPDKEVLSFNTLRYLKEVKEIIKNHKLASKLIFKDEFSGDEHYNETFVLWEYPDAIIHGEPLVVKSTIDKLIVNHDTKTVKLVDLKTTNALSEFTKRFNEHDGYKIQLACYWKAVETMFKEKFPDKNINDYTRETYLVAVQTFNQYRDYPVNCEVWPISDKSLQQGSQILTEVLPDLAWHFENDLWDHHRVYYEGDGSQIEL